MSTFGSPGGQNFISKPTPPERGSFPLDHDGECKSQMSLYLTCLRKNRGTNAQECRLLSKDYLECRMERNLMARDTMENLGYAKAQAQKVGLGEEDATRVARAAKSVDGTEDAVRAVRSTLGAAGETDGKS